MKYQLFAYYNDLQAHATGLLVGEYAYDLGRLAANAGVKVPLVSLDALLDDWAATNTQLQGLADRVFGAPALHEGYRLDLEAVEFAPFLARPGTIYAAGANYRDHVEAMARAFNMKLSLDPRSEGIAPWHFIKPGRGCLVAHKQSVEFPAGVRMLDWEAELAVVIGKRASRVSVEEALEYVAGYTCANDLSARDRLRREQVDASSPFRFDWIGHKCFTGSCPLGPYLTPAQFVKDPENLDIKLSRNGAWVQDSNTRNHMYGVAEQISYLSQTIDLFPGDVLLTGTPAGVGMESHTFLERGDVLKVCIEGLGELVTTIR
ncbi:MULTISPECIES: fumarylacetoacetate hydrolase family protein [Pseudomonas]|jgi:2-keto-4-pentenoate hydratase/2-oxohepta-3-ene-1,7-dioic acid hydratase in catechol pathway|uniref:fumarylacetoacetate hydrolase family protein n=1 Tax=Pseudomonas TaxID=286 RepID=UPI000761FFE3|nr:MULTISPECIES: fumarylacetoacetate hydrolase family protein [unclassified Pseudomonas]MDN5518646.1 fumarylacetoacetate hydrolase family protein [Pseudomonas sp.]MDN5530464.1 fumarylacetoacetate hydrolase family protein [Pseudomonas sp.]